MRQLREWQVGLLLTLRDGNRGLRRKKETERSGLPLVGRVAGAHVLAPNSCPLASAEERGWVLPACTAAASLPTPTKLLLASLSHVFAVFAIRACKPVLLAYGEDK